MNTLRQKAIKTRISDILNGKFVRKEGLEPSYVLTELGQKISRANLVATIVDKFMSEDGNYSNITVDDDSDSIRVKAFKENSNIFDNLDVGDSVMVIGKVREYADEKYIIPDIVKKIADPNYESLHRLEVLKQLLMQKKALEIIKNEKDKFADLEELKAQAKKYHIDEDVVEGIIESLSTEEETIEKDYKPLLLEVIERLDKGEGVEFRKLMEESKLPESIFEEVVNELLSNGICYEPSPGVIKKA
ncbi:MAG: OB-fold nucleic acid binding domain-containing protein [Candidatus Aenigmarchaeota archaeon]|nr:OB-fold nucleic acid binding domain-containing protein [Candidatus Aenigmarchaeota archaeon]